MKCPFELPVRRTQHPDIHGLFRIRARSQMPLAKNLTKDEADYIVQAINSHESQEKLEVVVRHLVSSATRYPKDYATKDLNKLIPHLIKEAKQALKEAKKK